jgi:DHA2 family multidrug resistance protein
MVGGFLRFFIFTFMMHNVMTPDTGVEHVLAFDFKRCWFGTTFLYPLSLSTLKGKKYGEGAAFTGMMRQLGIFWYRYYHYFYYSIYKNHRRLDCKLRWKQF